MSRRTRSRGSPLEALLEQAGEDFARVMEDLADGLLVAGAAALVGLGVDKAPAVVKAAREKTARRKAPPQARGRKQPDQGAVIDLVPGPDGVYR